MSQNHDEPTVFQLPPIDEENPLGLQPGDTGFIRVGGKDIPVVVDDQPTKYAMHLPVSCCVLTDTTGVNHCKHPPPPPPPWHRRIRYRIADHWWRLRERIGYAIAGHQPEEDE